MYSFYSSTCAFYNKFFLFRCIDSNTNLNISKFRLRFVSDYKRFAKNFHLFFFCAKTHNQENLSFVLSAAFSHTLALWIYFEIFTHCPYTPHSRLISFFLCNCTIISFSPNAKDLFVFLYSLINLALTSYAELWIFLTHNIIIISIILSFCNRYFFLKCNYRYYWYNT